MCFHPLIQRSALALLTACAASAAAAAQEIDVINPNRSGIPGDELRVARWAPDGTLWVAARWIFWGEGGIGVYDRHSRTWEVWSSETTPLPSQFVNDIEFEADGTAWLATDGGLVRKDGDQWTVWNGANSPLAFDKVGDLSLAPNGHVWVNNSSFSSGADAVYDFDCASTWVKHAVPAIPFAAPWTDLSEVFADSQGRVWVGNDVLPGVARYDGTSWTLLGEDVGYFDDMAEDGFGNLWLMSHPVTNPFGFHRYDGQQFTTYPLASPNVLVSDPSDGSIYVGSWNGVVLRTADGGASVQTFASGLNKIVGLAPEPESDDLWTATLGALGHFGASGALLADYNSWNTGFPDYFVDYFGKDGEDHFWVATGEAGLSRFDGLRWRNWGNHNQGSEPYPFAGNEPMGGVFQDSTGTHWMGGNGIARWDSATGQFTGFWNWKTNPGMSVTLFPYFAEDQAGRVFAADKYGAVFHFDPAAQLWIKEPITPYAPLELPGMASDPQGDVWVAGWFDVHRWDGAAWSKLTLPYPEFFFDKGGINTLAIGPDGVFWFGTVEGLVRWDGVAFTTYTPATTPLPGPYVSGIDVRQDGLVGIAARGSAPAQPSGIALLDGDPASPAAWKTFMYGSSPIPHWQLGRAAFDPRGDLWVSAISEGAAVVRTGAWKEGGFALAGTFREPQLVGKGVALGGETYGLLLTGAPAGAPGMHVVGFAPALLPLFGGTLVPSLDILIPFQADALGDAAIGGVWPLDAPAGLQLWVQSWFLDPGAVQGFSATNSSRIAVP